MEVPRASNASTAFMIVSFVCRSKSSPVAVSPSFEDRTISRAPPRLKAITGVPQAWASANTMPKSSQPAKTKAFAFAIAAARGRWPAKLMFGQAMALSSRSCCPSPRTRRRRFGMALNARRIRSMRL